MGTFALYSGYAQLKMKPFYDYCEIHHESLDKIIAYCKNKKLNKCLLFIHCCSHGYLNIAKWLYSVKRIRMRTLNTAFRMSCINGHVDVAKWLYSIGKSHVDIHIYNNFVFRVSITKEQIHVVQWLTKLCGELTNKRIQALELEC